MKARIGDIVKLNCDVSYFEVGEEFKVTGHRTSGILEKPVYDLIRLKDNKVVRGLYQYRFDLCKENNRDMY